jgi:uncharacterized membrane protein
MIGQTLAWWAVSSLLGAAAFPIAYRLLHRLPDRGYGLSRALGILIAGYGLWMGASIGVLRNDLGGALGGVVLLAVVGLWAGNGRWREIRRWLSKRRRTVVVVELLFLGAFALWAFVRSNSPDIVATEKPMELAFLNAILRSETFPPADPWLSGYAISYYYFGYVLLAFLARLTGVAGGVAFNLGNALWLALTVLGTYSILYNLLSKREGQEPLAAALLGPLFVVISGNLEGLIEVAYSRRWFWTTQPDGSMASRFWQWLNFEALLQPPAQPASWIPQRFWMWFQAARVVNDVDLAGRAVGASPITEFPLFSFLLADNHPHVLAVAFVPLAISVALHVYLGGTRGEHRLAERAVSRDTVVRAAAGAAVALVALVAVRSGLAAAHQVPVADILISALKSLMVGAIGLALAGVLVLLVLGALPSALSRSEFWFGAWVFGALAFLNTWDAPIYLSLLLAVAWWCGRGSPAGENLKRILITGAALGAAAILFCYPWYPAFASQAQGILPNLAFPTRFTHFLIMFGPMLFPLLAWLVWKAAAKWQRREWGLVLGLALGVPVALLLVSWILGALIVLVRPGTVGEFLSALGIPDWDTARSAILVRRLANPWTALALGGTGALSALLLWRRANEEAHEGGPEGTAPFVLMLIGIGSLLVLAPEYVYLNDLFHLRMNTVFKFYYAAWMLWGLAAAYIAQALSPGLRGLDATHLKHVGDLLLRKRWGLAAAQIATAIWPRKSDLRSGLRAVALLPFLLGFVYTVLATWSRTDEFNPATGRTLDGTAHLATENPGDYAAIQWINQNLTDGVLAEAVGGSYSNFARISVHTGIPTVIGWPWHEVQWRGDALLLGSREEDIRRLFQTREWTEAQGIIDRYGITYVYVGDLERAAYHPVVEEKFEAHMDVIYRSGNVTIYATRGREGVR